MHVGHLHTRAPPVDNFGVQCGFHWKKKKKRKRRFSLFHFSRVNINNVGTTPSLLSDHNNIDLGAIPPKREGDARLFTRKAHSRENGFTLDLNCSLYNSHAFNFRQCRCNIRRALISPYISTDSAAEKSEPVEMTSSAVAGVLASAIDAELA